MPFCRSCDEEVEVLEGRCCQCDEKVAPGARQPQRPAPQGEVLIDPRVDQVTGNLVTGGGGGGGGAAAAAAGDAANRFMRSFLLQLSMGMANDRSNLIAEMAGEQMNLSMEEIMERWLTLFIFRQI